MKGKVNFMSLYTSDNGYGLDTSGILLAKGFAIWKG